MIRLKNSVRVCLQTDESTDLSGKVQRLTFFKMLLLCSLMKGTGTGRDIFNKLDHNIRKRWTKVGKTVFVCAGGGGALQGGRKGSKSLRAGDGSPRESLALHHPQGSARPPARPQVSGVSASPCSTNVVRNCEFHQTPPVLC